MLWNQTIGNFGSWCVRRATASTTSLRCRNSKNFSQLWTIWWQRPGFFAVGSIWQPSFPSAPCWFIGSSKSHIRSALCRALPELACAATKHNKTRSLKHIHSGHSGSPLRESCLQSCLCVLKYGRLVNWFLDKESPWRPKKLDLCDTLPLTMFMPSLCILRSLVGSCATKGLPGSPQNTSAVKRISFTRLWAGHDQESSPVALLH